MAQRSVYAAAKDVQIKASKEECASSMVQSTNDAAMKDAGVSSKEKSAQEIRLLRASSNLASQGIDIVPKEIVICENVAENRREEV